MSNITLTDGLLPSFSSYDIANNTPFVDESTAVTVRLNFYDPVHGDISGLVGTLSVQLFWSRDTSTWIGETMTLISGNDLYRTVIPAQDGSDNRLYDYGAGTLFWYIRVQDTSTLEETFLFSSSDPNTEITFLPLPSQTTTDTDTTQVGTPNPIFQAIEDVLEPIVGQDVASDPVFQSIVISIFGVMVAFFVFTSKFHIVLAKVFGIFTGKRVK